MTAIRGESHRDESHHGESECESKSRRTMTARRAPVPVPATTRRVRTVIRHRSSPAWPVWWGVVSGPVVGTIGVAVFDLGLVLGWPLVWTVAVEVTAVGWLIGAIVLIGLAIRSRVDRSNLV